MEIVGKVLDVVLTVVILTVILGMMFRMFTDYHNLHLALKEKSKEEQENR